MTINDMTDPDVRRITERVRDYVRLYDFGTEAFDRRRLDHLYKRDAEFTAYDIAPPAGGYLGWDDYIVAWDRLLGKFSEFHFEINDDLRVFRRGDVAWTSASGHTSGKSADGEPFRKEMRFTLVFVREGDEWLITQEHGSAPRMFELPGGGAV